MKQCAPPIILLLFLPGVVCLYKNHMEVGINLNFSENCTWMAHFLLVYIFGSMKFLPPLMIGNLAVIIWI